MERQDYPSYCYPATAIDTNDDSDMLLQLEAFLLGTDDAERPTEVVSSDWSSPSSSSSAPTSPDVGAVTKTTANTGDNQLRVPGTDASRRCKKRQALIGVRKRP